MDALTMDRLKALLTSSSCTGMENLGNYLQLLFGPRRLIVGSAWRVVHQGDIAVGSGSSDDVIQEQLPGLLMGHSIRSVAYYPQRSPRPSPRVQQRECPGVLRRCRTLRALESHRGPDEMIIAGPGRLWSSF